MAILSEILLRDFFYPFPRLSEAATDAFELMVVGGLEIVLWKPSRGVV
jgi:hypothetical protein